jgi:dTDP-4-amino-4,6-dideoxygalactose transaminase
LALGIKAGDEVIVPSNTYIATWLAISHIGAKIIPIEPNINTFNIDINKIVRNITRKTKAIIMVHLYGQPCDIDPIIKIAKKFKLHLIEDAAQAHGAAYMNKKIGAHSDLVAWSFYPTKNLGALGDAGAITSNNKKLINIIKSLRNYGSSKRYVNDTIGFNCRLDSIQAAVLNFKLNELDFHNQIRENIALNYLKKIHNKNIILPKIESNKKHAWHLFVIRHKNRENLVEWLKSKGIETAIHYPIPPYAQGAYRFQFQIKDFPISSLIHNTCLSIPCNISLTQRQQKYIIDSINQFTG